MNRLIAFAVLALLFTSFASALDVKIYDNKSFEIDSFNVGQTVIIKAISETVPKISINEQNIYKSEMTEINKSVYEYRFVPLKEGTYNANISTETESVDRQFFVASGLDINWSQVETEFIGEKEANDTGSAAEQPSVKVTLNIGGSFFSRFMDWLKKGAGDRIG